MLDQLRDVAARVARAHEWIAEGEIDLGLQVLEDLELDVEQSIHQYLNAALQPDQKEVKAA